MNVVFPDPAIPIHSTVCGAISYRLFVRLFVVEKGELLMSDELLVVGVVGKFVQLRVYMLCGVRMFIGVRVSWRCPGVSWCLGV